MSTSDRWLRAVVLVCGLSVALPGQTQEPSAAADEQQPGGWRKFGEESAVRPPSQMTLPAGTWLTVRVNQTLSSDHNQPGDAFTATLSQPLIVNGYVVARRGQTVGGRVAEVQKAGRVKGSSRLGIELTEISLADGRQLPVRTQLIEYSGGTSAGRDATAVATTAGLGAAVGAAAEGGFGAGVGALAGAAAAAIGVLTTRGRATVVYPEAELTFRTLEPLAISTEGAERAFRPVTQEDYEPRALRQRAARAPTLYPPPPYYGAYYYPYWPFFYGPSFFYYSGPRYYHSRGYRRRW